MTGRDIAVLLQEIQEEIAAVERGDTGKERLGRLQADFLALMELVKLFLISERDSYYGYFLMNMRIQVNFYEHIVAGILLNAFPPVFVANPLLLCKFTLKEILYSVCHELDHILFNHPTEMVKAAPDRDPAALRRFNLAADAAVNDLLDNEIDACGYRFLSPPKGVITSRSLGRMFGLRRVLAREHYAYYYALLADQPMDDLPDRSDGAAGPERKVVTAQTPGERLDHDWGAGEDGEAAAAARELINAAANMMNQETRGLMPGYFNSQVELLNRPPALAWQSILKKYVGTVVADHRKTRTRLNRRQPERFDLSGRMDDKILKLVVAIDTSGSMSDTMITRIFNEIFAILAQRRREITVIECDTKVRRAYRACSPADIKTKVAGRGGTAFSPVIEYINKDRYFRDALLLYFTDGCGEGEIPRPRTYRNLWVILDNGERLSLKEPYGVVLPLSQ